MQCFISVHAYSFPVTLWCVSEIKQRTITKCDTDRAYPSMAVCVCALCICCWRLFYRKYAAKSSTIADSYIRYSLFNPLLRILSSSALETEQMYLWVPAVITRQFLRHMHAEECLVSFEAFTVAAACMWVWKCVFVCACLYMCVCVYMHCRCVGPEGKYNLQAISTVNLMIHHFPLLEVMFCWQSYLSLWHL